MQNITDNSEIFKTTIAKLTEMKDEAKREKKIGSIYLTALSNCEFLVLDNFRNITYRIIVNDVNGIEQDELIALIFQAFGDDLIRT